MASITEDLTTDAEPTKDWRQNFENVKIGPSTAQNTSDNPEKKKEMPNKKPNLPAVFNKPFFKSKQQTYTDKTNFMQQNLMAGGNLTAIQIGHANNIHFGNVVNFPPHSAAGSKRTSRPEPKKTKTKLPDDLLNNHTVVTEDMMHVVREGEIGFQWKTLGYALKLSQGALEAVENDHRMYGLNELAFQTLVEWHNKFGKEATVGKLANALSHIEREDLAMKILNES